MKSFILSFVIFLQIIISNKANSQNNIPTELKLNQTTNFTTETTINLNSTPSPIRSEPHQKNIPWEVLQFVLNGMLFVVGVTGNYLIVSTIIRDKNMHNLQNCFVFSLAITDFISLLLVLPLNMMVKYVSWPFGEFTCKYVLPIGDVVPAVSILTLVATSVDRYRAIVYALSKPPSLMTGISAIVMLWLATYLIVGLPLTFVFVVGSGHWVERTCYTLWKDANTELTYIIARTILFYVIPSIVIFHCYARVTKVLQRNLKFLTRSASGYAQVIRLKRQRRVMNMFFAIFVCFFVCYLPFNVIAILFLTSPPLQRWEYAGELFQITIIFAFTNSVCNPIILYKLSRGYRDSFRESLPFLKWLSTCICKDKNEEQHEDIDEQVAVNNKIRFNRRRSTKESHIVSFLTASPKLHRCSSPGIVNEELSDTEEAFVKSYHVVNNHLSPSTTQKLLSPTSLSGH